MVKNLLAMQEALFWSLGWDNPLEKRMATHSSILAWIIPGMEEPGGLQSTGLQSQTQLSYKTTARGQGNESWALAFYFLLLKTDPVNKGMEGSHVVRSTGDWLDFSHLESSLICKYILINKRVLIRFPTWIRKCGLSSCLSLVIYVVPSTVWQGHFLS